jgi:hypothetical protein
MHRKRFTLTTAVSALLCLCVCGLWVRSYGWSDALGVNSSPPGAGAGGPPGIPLVGTSMGTFVGLSTYRGSLYVVRFATLDAQTFPTGWSRGRIESPDDSVYALAPLRFAGFSFNWHGPDYTIAFVGVPLWLVLVACALPVMAKRLRARGRQKRGYCLRCGYDLRATPGQCPECGNVSENQSGISI